GLGRPRSTHDIDLFVVPEEAELALRALAKKGFRTEKTDPSWLYKGFKENILVDIIFKSKGEIYLDSEMQQKMITAEFHGRQLRFVAPEDLLIIKAAAHSELTPNHWHDAIGLLSHAKLDWNYLLKRARRAPRRILSLLLYAQSNDVWVPNWVIHQLHEGIFGNEGAAAPPVEPVIPRSAKLASYSTPSKPLRSVPTRGAYDIGHLREFLAEDPRTNELDIEIEKSGDTILLRGEVTQPERRESVGAIAAEHFPDCQIENQIRILELREPTEAEEINK
ncbi:MAG: nucleotidyltransferase, partial [Bdellovibrionota bacterium]